MANKINLEEDAQKPPPTDADLASITALVKQMMDATIQLAKQQAATALIAQRIEQLSTTEIPEAMKAIGLAMFKLNDGSIVEIKEDDYGSYTKENEPTVFSWMRKNDHGDLIKSQAQIVFGKGKEALVEKLQKVLHQKAYEGCVAEFKESIHPGTFKAFVREQLVEGKPLPKQIAIFHKSETIIKENQNGNSKKAAPSSKAKVKGTGKDLF